MTLIPPMPASVKEILREVAEAHAIDVVDILGRSLRHQLAHARWEWWARVLREVRVNGQPPSLPLIGKWADRDHTSILYGLRRHSSGRTWSKGDVYSGYSFGRRRGDLPMRLQLAQDIAEAA